MSHSGGALLNWLVADFDIFGLNGQNWMLVLFGGALAICIVAMFFDQNHNRPPTYI